MVSITLSVPDDTRKLMKRFPEMNWSGFVRKAIEEKAQELSKLESLKMRLAKERDFDDSAIATVRQGRNGRASVLKRL